jgi:hypothetical protein
MGYAHWSPGTLQPRQVLIQDGAPAAQSSSTGLALWHGRTLPQSQMVNTVADTATPPFTFLMSLRLSFFANLLFFMHVALF